MTRQKGRPLVHWLGAFVLLALVGVVYYFTGCPLKFWTGLSCPGCGMTRAWFELMQGHVGLAFYYHPLFWLPVPLVWVLLSRTMQQKPRWRTALLWIMAGLLLAVYVARLVVRHPVAGMETPGIVMRLRWMHGLLPQ